MSRSMLYKILNIGLFFISFSAIWLLCPPFHYSLKKSTIILGVVTVLYILLGNLYEIFKVEDSLQNLLIGNTLTLLITDGILFILLSVYTLRIQGNLILSFLLSWTILSFNAFIFSKTTQTEQSLLIYGKDTDTLKKTNKAVPVEAYHGLDGYSMIFLYDVPEPQRSQIIKICMLENKTVSIIPDIEDAILSGMKKDTVDHLPVLKTKSLSGVYLFFKRCMDILLSALGLVLFSPIMLLTAIAIKIEDGGPVFYRQVRVTKDNRLFSILKFRSMRTDAEKDGIARLSSGENDPRITRTGKFIRRTRIDELPQFLNVLKGEMSICGPRPERPEIYEIYEKHIPEFALRKKVKAGLTGTAQIYGQYNTDPKNKLILDLFYIANAGFWEDIRLILLTLKIIFVKESTEGIDSNAKTALN